MSDLRIAPRIRQIADTLRLARAISVPSGSDLARRRSASTRTSEDENRRQFLTMYVNGGIYASRKTSTPTRHARATLCQKT